MYFHDEHVIIKQKTDKKPCVFLAIKMKFYGIQFILTTATFYRFKTILKADVGGQCCPDLLCGVCQSKSVIFSREGYRVFGFRI